MVRRSFRPFFSTNSFRSAIFLGYLVWIPLLRSCHSISAGPLQKVLFLLLKPFCCWFTTMLSVVTKTNLVFWVWTSSLHQRTRPAFVLNQTNPKSKHSPVQFNQTVLERSEPAITPAAGRPFGSLGNDLFEWCCYVEANRYASSFPPAKQLTESRGRRQEIITVKAKL